MEDAILSATEKSTPSSRQHQVNADSFFDFRGIVHKEFVPPGQTVNGNFLLEDFERSEGKCEVQMA